MQKKLNLISHKGSDAYLYDLYHPETTSPLPCVLFLHGFKGFKDWGYWHLLAEPIIQAGFCFVKFNYTHNGTSIDHAQDFTALDKFSKNTYGMECEDAFHMIETLAKFHSDIVDTRKLYLIGHSRGGGLSMVLSNESSDVQATAAWAPIGRFDYLWYNNVQYTNTWNKGEDILIPNSRTAQQMPISRDIYDDYQVQQSRFDLPRIYRESTCPYHVFYGTEDSIMDTFDPSILEVLKIKQNISLIAGADHVFGGQHPYTESLLPNFATELLTQTIKFFKMIEAK